jgi:plastocyanin
MTLAACGGGTDSTPLPSGAQPPANCASVEDGVLAIEARDIAFSVPCMVAYAGEAFTIRLLNHDSMPHNVSLYTDATRVNELLRGDTIIGPDRSIDYDIDALDEGEYFFDCIVHPADMNGALYVIQRGED